MYRKLTQVMSFFNVARAGERTRYLLGYFHLFYFNIPLSYNVISIMLLPLSYDVLRIMLCRVSLCRLSLQPKMIFHAFEI
jgi:hypothetical protein